MLNMQIIKTFVIAICALDFYAIFDCSFKAETVSIMNARDQNAYRFDDVMRKHGRSDSESVNEY